MTRRVVELAEHLLRTYSAREVNELVRILEYYNKGVVEADRAKAMKYGTQTPRDRTLEEEVRGEFSKAASQSMYMGTTSTVCRYCGK
jgi:hypothetical protein